VTNTGAQRFYRRHGFVMAETTDGSGNEEHAPAIRFVWTAP
jgi:ribosomal protein S18 acetylase RimI-like enzyme